MSDPRDDVDAAVKAGRLAEGMWSAEKTAEFLGVDVTTLYRWRGQGHPLRSYKAGGLKYDPADVRAYLLSTAKGSAA